MATIDPRPARDLADLATAGDLLSRAWLAGSVRASATPRGSRVVVRRQVAVRHRRAPGPVGAGRTACRLELVRRGRGRMARRARRRERRAGRPRGGRRAGGRRRRRGTPGTPDVGTGGRSRGALDPRGTRPGSRRHPAQPVPAAAGRERPRARPGAGWVCDSGLSVVRARSRRGSPSTGRHSSPPSERSRCTGGSSSYPTTPTTTTSSSRRPTARSPPSRWRGGSVARVGEYQPVGTHPDHQRLGLGRALLAHGLRRFRDLGAVVVQVYAEADNPASEGLYDAVGFRRRAYHLRYERAAP